MGGNFIESERGPVYTPSMPRGIIPYAGLLTLSLLLYALNWAYGDQGMLFTFYRPEKLFFSSLAIFPLVIALCLAARAFFVKIGRAWLETPFSILLYFLMVRHLEGSLAVLAGFALFYWAEKKLPRNSYWNTGFVVVASAFLFLKFYLFYFQREFFFQEIWTTALVRECFGTRLFSWVIYRRILRGQKFYGADNFFGYMFSPIFFVLPNMLDGVPFHYFHEKRKELVTNERWMRAWQLGLWSVGMIALHYAWQNHLYRPVIMPLLFSKWGQIDEWFLLGGFFSFLANVIKITAAMGLQVTMARFLGYQIRYDMIYPLLARSPMELWKRQHNYVRQYLTEILIRPLFAFLVRHRAPVWLSIALAAIASYTFIVLSHSGWRAWEEPRPVFTSLALSLAFAVFILIPVLSASQAKAKFKSQRWARILLGLEEYTPLKKWRLLDVSFWAVTLLIVSFSKACIGLVRAWGISKGLP